MRAFFICAGIMCLIIGAIGAVLPLVPTVPLWLLAAFCFARSSDRLHLWLINHPVMGPAIADWNERGAIGKTAKVYATISIFAVLLFSVIMGISSMIIIVQAGILTAVLAFIWTRPNH